MTVSDSYFSVASTSVKARLRQRRLQHQLMPTTTTSVTTSLCLSGSGNSQDGESSPRASVNDSEFAYEKDFVNKFVNKDAMSLQDSCERDSLDDDLLSNSFLSTSEQYQDSLQDVDEVVHEHVRVEHTLPGTRARNDIVEKHDLEKVRGENFGGDKIVTKVRFVEKIYARLSEVMDVLVGGLSSGSMLQGGDGLFKNCDQLDAKGRKQVLSLFIASLESEIQDMKRKMGACLKNVDFVNREDVSKLLELEDKYLKSARTRSSRFDANTMGTSTIGIDIDDIKISDTDAKLDTAKLNTADNLKEYLKAKSGFSVSTLLDFVFQDCSVENLEQHEVAGLEQMRNVCRQLLSTSSCVQFALQSVVEQKNTPPIKCFCDILPEVDCISKTSVECQTNESSMHVMSLCDSDSEADSQVAETPRSAIEEEYARDFQVRTDVDKCEIECQTDHSGNIMAAAAVSVPPRVKSLKQLQHERNELTEKDETIRKLKKRIVKKIAPKNIFHII